ncbi:MAG: DUF3073 domain-containing protein [Pseudoclavibacter sp.]|nr:DUF3073 domain-containing protein [Pseudoclavibacter sp.]
MGRGRQKAKHTKVARTLKYSVPETDYNALERELAGARDPHEDELAKWSEYLEDSEHLEAEDQVDEGRADGDHGRDYEQRRA